MRNATYVHEDTNFSQVDLVFIPYTVNYKTRARAQLSVTLLPQAVSQTFRHI